MLGDEKRVEVSIAWAKSISGLSVNSKQTWMVLIMLITMLMM